MPTRVGVLAVVWQSRVPSRPGKHINRLRRHIDSEYQQRPSRKSKDMPTDYLIMLHDAPTKAAIASVETKRPHARFSDILAAYDSKEGMVKLSGELLVVLTVAAGLLAGFLIFVIF
ncbi:MAG: hypothetical protein QXU73_07375 [Thermoplasmata archaeon]